jgi:predicted metal-binding protein
MFTWDEINDTLCSSILYVITAINCGTCPNTTVNTNITCVYTQSNASVDNNYNSTCMFAVQTEICGYLRGEKSKYITVHTDGE